MNTIQTNVTREIIEDFAKEIKKRSKSDVKPAFDVIYFREWANTNHEVEVYEVPTELLRFRKDNGRIASDVLSHERNYGILSETSAESQEILKKFLEDKDTEKTNELINSIRHTGQRENAIITADGFLINGNRRKMALEKLWDETHEEKYHWMKVVILPGNEDVDNGGPPTVIEIEQIENRYQLQSEGKSEYYNFDKALSMRRKIDIGMTLKEQLRDNPNFARLTEKPFEIKVRQHYDDFIDPLKCIDSYLEQLNRDELYHSISTGISDREGRWQAFLDYSKHIRKKLDDDYKRAKMGIDEDEIGDVEEIAFKIIRMRQFPNLPKVHKIMIDLPKLFENPDAKKELFKLLEIDSELPKEDCFDENGKEKSEREKDHVWIEKNRTNLIKAVKRAIQIVAREKESETPVTLLEAAIKKLEHENMDLESIDIVSNYQEVRKKLVKIQDLADSLETDWYHLHKNLKKLQGKYKKR